MDNRVLIRFTLVLPGNIGCPFTWDMWCCSYIDETVKINDERGHHTLEYLHQLGNTAWHHVSADQC